MEDNMAADFSCTDMPREVLIEILVYLPVKSLIRFTCVCKSWLDLIKRDSRFAIRHYLTRSTLSCRLMDNGDLVVDYCGGYGGRFSFAKADNFLRLCMYSVTEKKTFRIEKKLEFGPGLFVDVSNFCHGIMCAYVLCPAGGSRILLCNPAIREVVSLPVSPNIAGPLVTQFGIGFDSTSNDYKIVAVILAGPSSVRTSWLVDVYSVRNGQWHSVHAISSLEQFGSFKGVPVLNANGRVLNMLGYRNSTEVTMGLLTFDMVDEVFQETSLPECLCTNERLHDLLPVSPWLAELLPSSRWQACLCCFALPHSDLKGSELYNVVDIWVLKGSKADADTGVGDGHEQIWNKQVSIRFLDDEVVWPMSLWMNDKELLVYVRKEGRLKEVFLYDLSTHQLKPTGRRVGRRGPLVEPGAYTESLVSIRGLMSSKSDEPVREQIGIGDGDGDGTEEDNREHGRFFIRELGKGNNVRWSYSFELI